MSRIDANAVRVTPWVTLHVGAEVAITVAPGVAGMTAATASLAVGVTIEGGANAATDVVRIALEASTRARTASTPRETPLTRQAVREAAGLPDRSARGPGRFRSLVAVGGRWIYFVYADAADVLLGRLDVTTGRVGILANTERLASSSGLGRSLAVAEVDLISSFPAVASAGGSATPPASGAVLWVWLRHVDRSVWLRFDPATVFDERRVALERPFDVLTVTMAGVNAGPLIPRPGWVASGGPGGGFLLTDGFNQTVWRVAPDGTAAAWLSTFGLPQGATPPLLRPADRTLHMVAPIDTVQPASADVSGAPTLLSPPDTPYPAWLLASVDADGAPGPFRVIDRHAWYGPPGYAIHTLRPDRLLPDPTTPDTFWAYDRTSGDVVRFELLPSW